MSSGQIALSFEMTYPKVISASKLKECLITVTDFMSRRPVILRGSVHVFLDAQKFQALRERICNRQGLGADPVSL